MVYIESRHTSVRLPHRMDALPTKLAEKTALLHFYYAQLCGCSAPLAQGRGADAGEGRQVCSHVYVKCWARTQHAVLFRLSSDVMQVCVRGGGGAGA